MGKIRCIPTGHELPPRLEPLQEYLQCRKYKQVEKKLMLDLKYDYSKYEPYIVEHKQNKKQLFCLVTRSTLNKVPAQVENHVNGKTYKRNLVIYRKATEGDDSSSKLPSDAESAKDSPKTKIPSEADKENDTNDAKTTRMKSKKKKKSEVKTTDKPLHDAVRTSEKPIDDAVRTSMKSKKKPIDD